MLLMALVSLLIISGCGESRAKIEESKVKDIAASVAYSNLNLQHVIWKEGSDVFRARCPKGVAIRTKNTCRERPLSGDYSAFVMYLNRIVEKRLKFNLSPKKSTLAEIESEIALLSQRPSTNSDAAAQLTILRRRRDSIASEVQFGEEYNAKYDEAVAQLLNQISRAGTIDYSQMEGRKELKEVAGELALAVSHAAYPFASTQQMPVYDLVVNLEGYIKLTAQKKIDAGTYHVFQAGIMDGAVDPNRMMCAIYSGTHSGTKRVPHHFDVGEKVVIVQYVGRTFTGQTSNRYIRGIIFDHVPRVVKDRPELTCGMPVKDPEYGFWEVGADGKFVITHEVLQRVLGPYFKVEFSRHDYL